MLVIKDVLQIAILLSKKKSETGEEEWATSANVQQRRSRTIACPYLSFPVELCDLAK